MESIKRRRLDNPAPRTPRTPVQRSSNSNAPARSPIESSSDELAAGSDHDEERRHASWTIQKTYPPKRPYLRSRSFSESESSDELAVDAEVYWRSRNRGGRSPTHSQSNMSSQEDGEDGEGEVEENEVGDSEAGDVGDEVHEVDHDAHSDRSLTPVPPPPPPKPEKLSYRQKYLLRGHLRGVSAVRFSPDASMLASAGMLWVHFSSFFCGRGRLLTGIGADGAIKVWDTLSGKLIHTFEGHLAGVSTIAWSPDCATIASGSDDKTIRLWNVLTVRSGLLMLHCRLM